MLLSLVICLWLGASRVEAGEAETVAAINAAAAALDDAFERQSAEDIKRMTTPDHAAVTPYYSAPRSVTEQIASLPDLKYKQTIIGEVKVILLGADAALRAITADLDGTFIPKRVFAHQRHGEARRPMAGEVLSGHGDEALDAQTVSNRARGAGRCPVRPGCDKVGARREPLAPQIKDVRLGTIPV